MQTGNKQIHIRIMNVGLSS